MNTRWQSYATPRMPDAYHRRWADLRRREAERQNAAAFQLHLRDAHDDGQHSKPVDLCDLCRKAQA